MKNLQNQNFGSERNVFDGGHKTNLVKQVLICSTMAFASGISFGIGIMRLFN